MGAVDDGSSGTLRPRFYNFIIILKLNAMINHSILKMVLCDVSSLL